MEINIFCMRKVVFTSVVLVILQFLASVYLYPSMPDRMAIHWGMDGTANGYGSKLMGLFLIPVISAVFLPLLLLLPRLDPSNGIDRFSDDYNLFVLGALGYMAYINSLSLTWNLGWRFDFGRMLAPVMGVGFYGLGVLMGKARLNWFMGIKTPWTLSSEVVWDKTHALGGRLFKVSGLIAFVGVFFRGWIALLLMIAPLMVASIYLIYYSYVEYQKEPKDSTTLIN